MVFFNSDPGTGQVRTDHSGIFMGVDDGGHYRFISSRSKADGPTFGDTGGAALLDDGGHWSQRFRNARRIYGEPQPLSTRAAAMASTVASRRLSSLRTLLFSSRWMKTEPTEPACRACTFRVPSN